MIDRITQRIPVKPAIDDPAAHAAAFESADGATVHAGDALAATVGVLSI